MKQKIKMSEIAKRLGTSTVTVSRALNGKKGVSEDLKEKIKELAKEMGYQINFAASALKTNRKFIVGVIISERYYGESDYFYFEIYRNMNTHLSKNGYSGMLYILSKEEEALSIIPRMVTEHMIDGLIVLGELDDNYLDILIQQTKPVLFVDFYSRKFMDVDSVLTDNFFSTYKLTTRLIHQGLKKITFVGNINRTQSIMDRYLGYYKAMSENHLDEYIAYIDDIKDKNDKEIEIELPVTLPELFLCNCDITAYILLRKLHELGYEVPKDTQVVGYDDTIYSRIAKPSLTTLKVNTDEMSKTAVKCLIKKIETEKKYGRILIDTNLIIRDSCQIKEN